MSDDAPASAPPAPAPAESPAASADSPAPTEGQPLSKKAQKRLAKAAYIAERKKERRAAEKERRKEKKRALAEKRAAGELDGEEEEAARDRKRQKTEQGPRTAFNARVVVDLGFDENMTENVSGLSELEASCLARRVVSHHYCCSDVMQEVKSLTSQLAYTYSANRKAVHPFSSLLFTSLDGRTLARMDAMNNAAYKRWVNAEWWEEDYPRLWEGKVEESAKEQQATIAEETHAADSVEEAQGAERKKQPRKRAPSRADRETVVYLTADSEEELTELKEGETYNSGGIVDHNRYKVS